jgi:hypothetical protein
VRSLLPKIDDKTWYACKGNCTPRLVRSIIARVKNDPSFVYDFHNEKSFKEIDVTMQMEAIWKLGSNTNPQLLLAWRESRFLIYVTDIISKYRYIYLYLSCFLVTFLFMVTLMFSNSVTFLETYHVFYRLKCLPEIYVCSITT